MKCQQSMHAQLESDIGTLFKDIKNYDLPDSTIKAIKAVSSAVDFCGRLTQLAAGCFRDLSDLVFINVANFTLLRRDAFLDTVRTGITPDTLNKLRTSHLHTEWLFSDDAICKAEAELKTSDKPPTSKPPSSKSQGRYHPYKDHGRRDDHSRKDKPKSDSWRRYGKKSDSKPSNQPRSTVSKPAKGQKTYK